MKRPDGITSKTDITGNCDLCNINMSPSGGIISATALRLLVEDGFEPEPETGVMAILKERMKEYSGLQMKLEESGRIISLKQKILRELLGDFGVCPDCYQRVLEYCD